MTEIAPFLFIGATGEIALAKEGWFVVNTAHTYHYQLHEWRLRDGADRTQDPCYVVCEDEPNTLSINWIDGEAKYFDYKGKGLKVFKRAMDFIDEHRGPTKVLIVCNKAESRAPSLAMLYLAKRTPFMGDAGKISYNDARTKFTKMYPNYLPGSGITTFLIDHWYEL